MTTSARITIAAIALLLSVSIGAAVPALVEWVLDPTHARGE